MTISDNIEAVNDFLEAVPNIVSVALTKMATTNESEMYDRSMDDDIYD